MSTIPFIEARFFAANQGRLELETHSNSICAGCDAEGFPQGFQIRSKNAGDSENRPDAMDMRISNAGFRGAEPVVGTSPKQDCRIVSQHTEIRIRNRNSYYFTLYHALSL